MRKTVFWRAGGRVGIKPQGTLEVCMEERLTYCWVEDNTGFPKKISLHPCIHPLIPLSKYSVNMHNAL